MPRIIYFHFTQFVNDTYTGKLPSYDIDGARISYSLSSSRYYIDPRPILHEKFGFKYVIRIFNAFDVEIIKIKGNLHDVPNCSYPDTSFSFKSRPLLFMLFDSSIEDVPDFLSTSYTYHGLFHEVAPSTATSISFSYNVKNILHYAFTNSGIHECIIPSGVVRIFTSSFAACYNLRVLVLPQNLHIIDENCFNGCTSLSFVYIPSSVRYISKSAFGYCPNLKYIFFEDPFDILVHYLAFRGSYNLYFQNNNPSIDTCECITERRRCKTIISRYESLPLHVTCGNPRITKELLETCLSNNHGINGVEIDRYHHQTALHILAVANHFTTVDTFMGCLKVNEWQAFMKDKYGKTPIDYLWENSRIECVVQIMNYFCQYKLNTD